ncbi:helix-turn-helix domain-containing protein [Nocardia otitidiscaviarum]|uniref:GlxA family transcriptional regulator n=1 Tax=Nocardia otitidiscaviarum TaxID=1823 RepID=UPI0018955176|nr:helix-turn-helix domain-containing protein [Nocardia otitidiscaviarum]MBF6239622.1 helix-turn-helix domain-containing protein [Nocardia otitidiscaviarum]
MNVAVFVVDGVADFGYAALIETFSMANGLRERLPQSPPPWRVHTVSFGHRVRSGNGHSVTTTPLAELREEVDLVIVPAVNVLDAQALIGLVSAPHSRPVLEHIRRTHDAGGRLAAACTGTFFLAEAGVLDGAPATTSWWLGPSFRRRYPRVALDESRLLCRGGRITTAGASLSHMDLALSLVHGRSPALAELTARYLALGNRDTQAAFAVPEVVARGDALVAAFERWVRAHLSEPLHIATAARELGTTTRTLQRATRAEIGLTPREFANDIRLERAAHLLRTTTLTVDSIAAHVGYSSPATLRTLVRRRHGMTLAELRAARGPW